MNRSLFASPWAAISVLVAVVASLAMMVASPATANAQDDTSVVLSISVSEPVPGQTVRTAALALDPGTSGLAALGATLTFNTADVVVSSCAISEVGACNVDDGTIKVSVFSFGRLRANDQLLTFDFVPTAAAQRTTAFAVEATTAVTSQIQPVSEVIGATVEVEITQPVYGSLTGTIVAADTATALFAIDVCATHLATSAEVCTSSTGLGNWRIDDVETGDYAIAMADPAKVYETATTSGFVHEGEVASVAEIAMDYFVESAAAPAEEASPINTPVTDTPAIESPAGQVTAAVDQDPAVVTTTREDPVDTPVPAVLIPRASTPPAVVYGASIEGHVTWLQTDAGVSTAQVCAVRPRGLEQHCVTTDADGSYRLSGLSAGNYWVRVMDPLGEFEQTRARLVGLVRDTASRTGVKITMRPIAE